MLLSKYDVNQDCCDLSSECDIRIYVVTHKLDGRNCLNGGFPWMGAIVADLFDWN